MRVKVNLTTNSPKIWKCWRSIGGDLDSSAERISRPRSRSAADCVGGRCSRTRSVGGFSREVETYDRSEWKAPSGSPLCRLAKSVVAGIGGRLKWRVRSEPKQHDNPGAQRSHSIPHLHV